MLHVVRYERRDKWNLPVRSPRYYTGSSSEFTWDRSYAKEYKSRTIANLVARWLRAEVVPS